MGKNKGKKRKSHKKGYSSSDKEEFEIVPQIERNDFEIIPEQKVTNLDEAKLEIYENHFLFGGADDQNDSDSDIEVLTRSTTEAIETTKNKLYSNILMNDVLPLTEEAVQPVTEKDIDLLESFGDIIEGKTTPVLEDQAQDGSSTSPEEEITNTSSWNVIPKENEEDICESLCEEETIEFPFASFMLEDWEAEIEEQNESIEIVFSHQATDDKLTETYQDFIFPIGIIEDNPVNKKKKDKEVDLSGIKELFQFANNDSIATDGITEEESDDDEDGDDDFSEESFDDESVDEIFNLTDEFISMKTSSLTIIFCSCVLLGVIVGSGCASMFVYLDNPTSMASSATNQNEGIASEDDVELLLKSRDISMNISQIWPSDSNSKQDVKRLLKTLWMLQEENKMLKSNLNDYQERYHLQKQMSWYWKKQAKKDVNRAPNKIYDGLMNVDQDGSRSHDDIVDAIINDVENFSTDSSAVRNQSEIIKQLEENVEQQQQRVEYWKQQYFKQQQQQKQHEDCGENDFSFTTCVELIKSVLPAGFEVFYDSTENLTKPVEKIGSHVQNAWSRFKNGWKKDEVIKPDQKTTKNVNKLRKMFSSIISKKNDVKMDDSKSYSDDDLKQFKQRWTKVSEEKVTYPKPEEKQRKMKFYSCSSDSHIEIMGSYLELKSPSTKECKKRRKIDEFLMEGCVYEPTSSRRCSDVASTVGTTSCNCKNAEEIFVNEKHSAEHEDNEEEMNHNKEDEDIKWYSCERDSSIEVFSQGYLDMMVHINPLKFCSVYQGSDDDDDIYVEEMNGKTVLVKRKKKINEQSNNKGITTTIYFCENEDYVVTIEEGFLDLQQLLFDTCRENTSCGYHPPANDQIKDKCIAYQNLGDFYFESLNGITRQIERQEKQKTTMNKVKNVDCNEKLDDASLQEYERLRTLLIETCQKEEKNCADILYIIENNKNKCVTLRHMQDFYTAKLNGSLLNEDDTTQQNEDDTTQQNEDDTTQHQQFKFEYRTDDEKEYKMIDCKNTTFEEIIDEGFMEMYALFVDECVANDSCSKLPSYIMAGEDKCIGYEERIADLYCEVINGKVRIIKRHPKKQNNNIKMATQVEEASSEKVGEKLGNRDELSDWLNEMDEDEATLSNELPVEDGQEWYKKKLEELKFRFDVDRWKMDGEFQKRIDSLEKQIQTLQKKEKTMKTRLKSSKEYLLNEKKKHKTDLKKLKTYVNKQKNKLDEWKFKEKLQLKSNIDGLKKKMQKQHTKHMKNLSKTKEIFKKRLEESYKKLTGHKDDYDEKKNKIVKKVAHYRTKYQTLEIELQDLRMKYEQLLKNNGDQSEEDTNAKWRLPSIYCPNADNCIETIKQQNNNEEVMESKHTIFELAQLFKDNSFSLAPPPPPKPSPPANLIMPPVKASEKKQKNTQDETAKLFLRPSPPKSVLKNLTLEEEEEDEEKAYPLAWYHYWGRGRETYNIYDERDVEEMLPLNWYLAWMQSRDEFRREHEHELTVDEMNWYLKLMEEREKQRNTEIPMSWYFKWMEGRKHRQDDDDDDDDN